MLLKGTYDKNNEKRSEMEKYVYFRERKINIIN